LKPNLRDTLCPALPWIFLCALVLAGGFFFAENLGAMPRAPLPPIPEWTLPIWQERFDEYYFPGETNNQLTISGLGLLDESWSGYALNRAGDSVIPFTIPALDPSGNTNVTSDTASALRFWFKPDWSSQIFTNGTGPGINAVLLECDAVSGGETAYAWSLQISPDGNTLEVLAQTDAGIGETLATSIAWEAGKSHFVVLNCNGSGSALNVDGQFVATGSPLPSIPPSVGELTFGSTASGINPGEGDFDECYSFGSMLTGASIAMYYQMTSNQAALGPEHWHHHGRSASPEDLGRVYDPDSDGGCPTGGHPYMTNFSATPMTNGTTTISFNLAGGTNGYFYDVYSLTRLSDILDSAQWTWVGQTLTCNSYTFTNQPADYAFYFVMVPVQTTIWAWGEDADGQTNVPVGLTDATAIAAGGYFSLALLNNGTVTAWGDNAYGQTNLPSGLTNVVGIAAGLYHGVALLADGSVTNWGYYDDGAFDYCSVTNRSEATSPPTSNVVAVAAGQGQDLALMSNGTVYAWGQTIAYGTQVPTNLNLTNVTAIACGFGFNLALSSNGTVTAWGNSEAGLGYDLTNVPGDLTTNVVAIAAGGVNALALRRNGTVEAWGDSGTGVTDVPSDLSNVVAVATGGNAGLALQADGAVVVWGYASLTNPPSAMVGVKGISAGFYHSMAVASYGLPFLETQPPAGFAPSGSNFTFSVSGVFLANVQYQWQSNGVNLTGETNATLTLTNVGAADSATYQVVVYNSTGSATSLPATFAIATPPQITSTNPSAIGSTWINYSTTLSVAATAVGVSDYPLSYAWQLNGTNLADSSSSYAIPNLTPTNDGNYTIVVTNALGSVGVTWDVRLALPGMVEAWGSDTNGECDRPVTLTNVAGIAAGEYHSVAVTDSGTVLQWGKYSDGTNFYAVTNATNATAPPTSNVVAVAASRGRDLALLGNRSVTSWGLTNDIANWVPANLSNVTAIAAGWYHNVALSNGIVIAWGDNTYGQTNVPSDLTNAIAIATGELFSIALRSNGTVEAWGDNTYYQTNVPSGLLNVVAIAAGAAHNLALKADGTVVAWGNNDYNQTNVPMNLSNVMAVAAGDAHCVALKNDGTLVEWGNNSEGQSTVPAELPTSVISTGGGSPPTFSTNAYPPVVVKLIAAGGDHTMATIFSPLVQYPVDVTKDLLLIYNVNSADSSNGCQYYLTHRPMVSNCTNVLGIGCITNETILPTNFTNDIEVPIQNWLAANPTKHPAYVILFQDIPSRADEDASTTNSDGTTIYNELASAGTPSVQYRLNQWCATNWHPFVSSINMNGIGGTNDCIAYINKLAFIGTNYSPGQLIISASAGATPYGDSNWYFDDTNPDGLPTTFFRSAATAVTNIDPAAVVTYMDVTSYPAIGTSAGHITNGFNVAGFGSWGVHGYFSDTNGGYATNETIQFTGQSDWFVIETGESFNGQRVCGQGNFLSWYASNAFGGTAYSNTPVGAVCNVNEPYEVGLNIPSIYFGGWAAGRIFAYCAWNSFPYDNSANSMCLQVVGDPFTSK
jgi:alpha-tubulin suppressor-like RCC1 family protein